MRRTRTRAAKAELAYIRRVESASVSERLKRGDLEIVHPRDYPEPLKRFRARQRAMKKKAVNPRLPGRYGRMSAAELDREVEIFDQEFIADTGRPLSAAEWARLKRARSKGVSAGEKKRVVVALDSRLVRRTDAFAKKRGMTRAELIADALRTVLGRTG